MLDILTCLVGRVRFPVILGPPTNIIVLVVLGLQPVNERFKIVHEGLGAHFGLTGDQGHGFGPRLAVTKRHQIAANSSTSQGQGRHVY